MKKLFYVGGPVVALGLAVVFLGAASERSAEQGSTAMPAARDVNHQQAPLLSAFFGLDNSLPFGANRLCLGASGQDGMPVVLSQTIDPETLQPEDFQIVTRSGAKRTPHCATLRPAQDAGELSTVLLIGEFGNADGDPPVAVHVVGDLFSDGRQAEEGVRVNFRGSQTAVIPLDAGPSLVLAESVPMSELAEETRGTVCPEGVKQVVRVTWAGGVRLPNRRSRSASRRDTWSIRMET